MAQKETEREPVPEQTEESPGPDSPTELQASDWKVSGVRTFKEIKDDRVTLTAGALAYNWFLAMFPSLIALIGVMTLIQLSPSTVSQLVTAIQQVLPPGA
ncbi:MAG TPA: YhjD/YihY/BrkB family envelope integrity protein, partial [Actinomycetota bacterium]|nr:YhjD/YihY/BrkB family envelope integrity protein [Actinomycetota bacterium]